MSRASAAADAVVVENDGARVEMREFAAFRERLAWAFGGAGATDGE